MVVSSFFCFGEYVVMFVVLG